MCVSISGVNLCVCLCVKGQVSKYLSFMNVMIGGNLIIMDEGIARILIYLFMGVCVLRVVVNFFICFY